MGGRVGLALALAVLALAGCSAGESNGGAPAVAPAPAERADGQAERRGQEGLPDQAAEPVAQGRQLVRTAKVELRAADVAGVLARVKELAIAAGGFPAQENTTEDRGTVTLRVPGDRLDALLASLAGLPDVAVGRREVRTEDVTDQVVDVEARLANQRASVERVRGLLERAGSTSEITAIEAELTKRQSDLESLQRRHDALKGRIALSTLTVSVAAGSSAPAPPEDEDFLTALAGGWDALVGAAAWLLVVIGAALPFAVVLGAPLLGYLLWRRRRRAAVTPATRTGE
ncbi:DUF4349 domain-containing protein [Saccharothrix algeriensis]|uniref:DUF4349 domain-containing protein n=1 Tax=Saccharothrix algeriensis TaxID=173560 RepID=A0A8T8HRR9_9PSEU|nr:DUF4349 domain-containing protein [Saccharothrix algeriensis]MBM7812543.1 hypothetical protein [Saccharothrix algeriensis]QTR01273.1 DUF4349 domain-containing protein [Saccharothrix algeriensis]